MPADFFLWSLSILSLVGIGLFLGVRAAAQRFDSRYAPAVGAQPPTFPHSHTEAENGDERPHDARTTLSPLALAELQAITQRILEDAGAADSALRGQAVAGGERERG